jgi:hypothetical protein
MPLCPPPEPLLAKALQHVEVHPDLPAAPLFGIAQSMERRRREPRLHAEDDELPQPHAGGIELGLDVGLGGARRLRSPGSDGLGTFVQAAWVVLIRPQSWERYGLKPWIEAAKRRLHHNVLAIALANKLARIAWAVLNKGRNFEVVRTTAPSSQPA